MIVLLASLVTAVVVVPALTSPADAACGAKTNKPVSAAGGNAKGFGSCQIPGAFHDIDRKHCNWHGCNYLDGSNVFYVNNPNGVTASGNVFRGKHCGEHRYRNQSSNGQKKNKQLTLVC